MTENPQPGKPKNPQLSHWNHPQKFPFPPWMNRMNNKFQCKVKYFYNIFLGKRQDELVEILEGEEDFQSQKTKLEEALTKLGAFLIFTPKFHPELNPMESGYRWGKVSRKKWAVLLDLVWMRGGGCPAQIYCHLFISAFLVNRRSLFPPKCQ